MVKKGTDTDTRRTIARAFALVVVLGVLAMFGLQLASAPVETKLTVPSWTLDGVPITVPSHLDDRLATSASTYAMHAEVELPGSLRDRDLTFAIPYFAGRSTLRVDGEEAVRVTDDLVVGYRSRGPQSFRIGKAHTTSGHLQLELTVAHTWTQSGWFETTPRLLPATERDFQTLAVRAVNDVGAALAFAALAQHGVTYVVIFFFGKRRRSYVWFAIQAVAASFLFLFYMGFSQRVLGVYDVSVLAISIAVATIASVNFTHSHFKLGPPSRWWNVLLAFDVFIALAGAGPFQASIYAAKTTVGTLVVVIVWQIVTLARLTRKEPRPLGAETVLASWLVLALFSVCDGSAWMGFGELLGGVHGECVGLAAFAFMQSLFLGREHIWSLERSDELNATLAQRVEELEAGHRENEQLAEELRRQITDRSRQLFAALALIGAPQRDAPALQIGSLVQDRYRVVRPIGQGGMGIVYEVIRVSDDRRLALKVTRELDGTALARLAREAQIASHITHRNVVGILDVDVDPSGFLYLVLEYIDGPTLRTLKSRLESPAWAMSVLAQVAEGLAAIHAHGVVHRDLKPSNVMVGDADTESPIVKLTDFGVSRLIVDPESTGEREIAPPESVPPPSKAPSLPPSQRPPQEDIETRELMMSAPPRRRSETPPSPASAPATSSSQGSPLTEAGMLVGTPVYMAPELALEPQLSPSADMFSLGVMMYELLAGIHAYRQPPALARLEGRSIRPPASLATHRSDLDDSVITLIDACLSLNPAARPTAEELARTVRACEATTRASPFASTRAALPRRPA